MTRTDTLQSSSNSTGKPDRYSIHIEEEKLIEVSEQAPSTSQETVVEASEKALSTRQEVVVGASEKSLIISQKAESDNNRPIEIEESSENDEIIKDLDQIEAVEN